jgi:hypothetical protein
MRKKLAVLAALVATAPGLTACSDSTSSSADSSPTASESTDASTAPSSPTESSSSSSPSTPSGTTVDITIKNGKVSPNGDRVKAELGKPITLKIDADTAGELHVHATPEQEIAFGKGTSTKKLTIDKPGIVDVEDHELEQVIVQLQVS